jgi:hypothetical protein
MTSTMDSPAGLNGNGNETLRAHGGVQLTKSKIAKLSQADMRQMISEELIDLILVADVPLLREYVAQRLWYSDRGNLEKVAFLAQRTLRNQGY